MEPTTLRVISSCRPDYEHVLRSSVRHTLGLIDDEELAGTWRKDIPIHRTYFHEIALERRARR